MVGTAKTRTFNSPTAYVFPGFFKASGVCCVFKFSQVAQVAKSAKYDVKLESDAFQKHSLDVILQHFVISSQENVGETITERENTKQ